MYGGVDVFKCSAIISLLVALTSTNEQNHALEVSCFAVIILTKRFLLKVSVKGFIINTDTLMSMIPEQLHLQLQRYICTYRFRQDHLELLFKFNQRIR